MMRREQKAKQAIISLEKEKEALRLRIPSEDPSDSGLEAIPEESNHAEEQILNKAQVYDATNIEILLSTIGN